MLGFSSPGQIRPLKLPTVKQIVDTIKSIILSHNRSCTYNNIVFLHCSFLHLPQSLHIHLSYSLSPLSFPSSNFFLSHLLFVFLSHQPLFTSLPPLIPFFTSISPIHPPLSIRITSSPNHFHLHRRKVSASPFHFSRGKLQRKTTPVLVPRECNHFVYS
jgi:hypothetical protein